MKPRHLALFVLIVFLVNPACALVGRGSAPVSRLKGPYRIMVYDGPRPDFEGPIAAGSSEERAIDAWLLTHDSGWGIDFNTYVPGRQVIGKNFRLNFSGKRCILNYTTNADGQGSWRQVSRAIEAEEVPAVFARPAGKEGGGDR